jgi:mono/diheme cytochrome c family protein
VSLAACTAGSLVGGSGSNNGINVGNANTTASGGATTINGVVYTASSLVGGATIDPNHFWPPTGQDCTAQLGGVGKIPTAPPQVFLDECAGCHLATGIGTGNFPDITGQQDYNTMLATVRSGIQGGVAEMPAFKTTWLNDDDTKRIFAYLSQTPLTETGVCSSISPMTAADIATASQTGLAAWREFDGRTDPNGMLTNVACIQCHAPDPLDIAYYGYSDGDILRRGTGHLPASHVSNIVDMVHGLRTQYKIGRRDPLAVRPFQPGSIVLQGNSIAARDEAFMQQLVDMNLIVATRPITTVADANV